MLVNFYKKIIDKAFIMKISSLSTFPLPPVVVFCAKSVCVQYKKVTINGFFLRIVIFCYIMWRDIKYRIISYCTAIRVRVTGQIFRCHRQTPLLILYGKFWQKKLLSALPEQLHAREITMNFVQDIEKIDVGPLGELLPRNKNTTLVEF